MFLVILLLFQSNQKDAFRVSCMISLILKRALLRQRRIRTLKCCFNMTIHFFLFFFLIRSDFLFSEYLGI